MEKETFYTARELALRIEDLEWALQTVEQSIKIALPNDIAWRERYDWMKPIAMKYQTAFIAELKEKLEKELENVQREFEEL